MTPLSTQRSELIIYHHHMRAMNYCNRGLRAWFAGQGFSWADFLANGISATRLTASGNAMALAVAEFAEKSVVFPKHSELSTGA